MTGKQVIEGFKDKNGFDPSCGIMAFDFFVKQEEFETIGLVGIDCFKVGERGYYYTPTEVQSSLKYLYSDSGETPFDLDGVRIKESGHDSEKSENFIRNMVDYYNKKLLRTGE